MANDHTLYVRQGAVGTPAESNKNPSPAQSSANARGGSPIGTALIATTMINSGKQIMNGVIGEIGFVTGNYELQEQAETLVSIVGMTAGVIAAPMVAIPALTIKFGFDVYKNNITQERNVYKQQQNQILTGKVSVNGGRWN